MYLCIMHRLILSAVLSTFAIVGVKAQFKAQLENITLQDIYGEEYILFDELEAGKVVVFDFYSYYCGNCQANTPKMDTIWQNNGGADSVWVWGIETAGYDSSMIETFKSTYHASFPMFSTMNGLNTMTHNSHMSVFNLFGVGGTPTYVVVCPDFSFNKFLIGEVQGAINSCKGIVAAELVTGLNNILKVRIDNSTVITFPVSSGPNISLEIIDMLGVIRHRQHVEYYPGTEIKLTTENLQVGYYIVRMIDAGGKVRTSRVFVR